MAASRDVSARGWVALGALGLSSLLAAIANSSVATILPVLQKDLGTDLPTIGLTLTAYQIATASLLLTFGRLGDLRGHRAIYLTGVAVFSLASGACGLAPNAAVLIGARVVQAIGAAMLISTNVAILTGIFPARLYGLVLGLFSLATYLGMSGGPIVAGVLADSLGWRSVFLLNVPSGAVMLALALRFVPRDAPATGGGRFDRAGAVTFTLALAALIVGLEEGSTWGWTSPPILMMGLGAVVLSTAFVMIESRLSGPMLDLGLFRRRAFSIATATSVLNYIGVSATAFLLPYYLIHGRGLTPTQAGLYLSAQPVAQVLAAPLSGALSDRIGARFLSTAGMAGFALGLALLARLGPETPLGEVTVALVVAGLGTGTFISPNSSAMMHAAPRERHGTASGVQSTARYVGMALGVSTATAAVTSVTGAAGSLGSPEALFPAISLGFVIAASLAAIGAAASAVRTG